MSDETLFSGKSDAKGRNGYFKLHKIQAIFLGSINDETPYMLDIYSKRDYGAPPIRIMLNEPDLIALSGALVKLLAEKDKPEETV